MKTDQIDQVIDHVAGLLKIGIRRVIEEADKASPAVSQVVDSTFSSSSKSDDSQESCAPLVGTIRFGPGGAASAYTVIAFSRRTSSGEALLLVRFVNGQIGEYPLSRALLDSPIPG